jgi:hypothetical protein
LFADLSKPPVSAHWLEAPAIAPRSFVQPSRLLVGDEATNNIYSLSPWDDSRSVSIMAQFPGIEDIDFIPQNLCTYGDTNGAYFSAVPSSTGGEIDKRPPSDFAGYGGAAVLTSEYGTGLSILTGPNSVTPFQYGYDHNRTYEGSTFMTYKAGCGAVTDTRGYTATGVPLAQPAWDSRVRSRKGLRMRMLPWRMQALRQKFRKHPPRRLKLRGANRRAQKCARKYERFRGPACVVRRGG